LANSLQGFGTGRMGYFGNEIDQINCPVVLITGELDTKFTKINSVLKKNFPNAMHKIIKNAGHNTHLEEPGRFVKVVNNFLKSL
jgi:2-succinyl-6-hydroxy-2,4-cyclohexadiene-1-carboxylate synthase